MTDETFHCNFYRHSPFLSHQLIPQTNEESTLSESEKEQNVQSDKVKLKLNLPHPADPKRANPFYVYLLGKEESVTENNGFILHQNLFYHKFDRSDPSWLHTLASGLLWGAHLKANNQDLWHYEVMKTEFYLQQFVKPKVGQF